MSLFELPPSIAALEGSDDALVVVNQEGAVVLMTPEAEKIFGVSAEDIVGEFVEMLVPPKLRWGHQAYRRGYFAEPNPREMDPGLFPYAERPDGELVPIDVWLDPRRENDELYVVGKVTVREGPAGDPELP